MLMRFAIFGVLGIFGSVIATAAFSIVATRKIDFTGRASLVLFPFFGLIALIYPLIAMNIGGLPWYGRGLVFMAAFYILQFLAGLLLTKIRLCPWSYSGNLQLAGLVRLADAPAFFLAGLAIEWVYPFVKTAANAL